MAFYKPLKAIAHFILKYFLVPLYKIYFTIKKWLIKIFSPAKNKIIYPLVGKQAIHIIILVITIAVITNNIGIRETRAEEFGQKTILASLVTDVHDVEIVEKALTETVKTTSYYKTTGAIALSETVQNGSLASDTEESEIITTEGLAALVKPSLASTTIGNRPREQVEYYIVQEGDTISTIAEKFNLTTNTLLWENKLGPRDYIKPGDKLTILPLSGISHQIKKGDTLEKVAQRYGVNIDVIIEYNQLADASAIEIDQILIIPDGEMPTPPKPKIQPPSTRYALFDVPDSAAISGTKLQWPTTSRKISQYYKWRHLAIDIAGDYTSPIYVAETGRVESVGWGRGYGNRIIVNHGNGMKTLYAHASKMFVASGDSVQRGQTIGMIGCTGWCTGPHVHFEVIINGKKTNPLNYL